MTRDFAAVVNCTGPRGDPEAVSAGLIADLRRQGALRRDPLGLGLDVDRHMQVIGAGGTPTPGLYAVGPLTRAAVWEALAVPDLRSQTAEVAATVRAALMRSASSSSGRRLEDVERRGGLGIEGPPV